MGCNGIYSLVISHNNWKWPIYSGSSFLFMFDSVSCLDHYVVLLKPMLFASIPTWCFTIWNIFLSTMFHNLKQSFATMFPRKKRKTSYFSCPLSKGHHISVIQYHHFSVVHYLKTIIFQLSIIKKQHHFYSLPNFPSKRKVWLVIWNITFIFHSVGNNHHPNWRTHTVQRVRAQPNH